jgi:hypothetical protein
MAAQELYDAIHQAISDHLEQDEELSTFELVGVVRMIGAEMEAAAVAQEEEEEETEC